MDSLRICLLAVAGVTVITVIRKWNSDFLPLVRLCLALLLAAVALALAAPVVDYLRELTALSGIPGYAEFLFKALGIAVLTQCCAALCRESGEVGAAGGVELAGKLEILLLSLPLINEILSTARELLNMAG